MKEDLFQYCLQLGDSSLILGQRLGEWCGHAPILEVDIAMTNIALDLLGQTRSYFQYAAEVEGKGRDEDKLAFMREENEYRNYLLLEQPNEDFAYTIIRQFFFDTFHMLFLEKLANSSDEQLAAIAAKSLKEVKYHFRFSSDWVRRLGDGTEESHRKVQQAVDDLWMFTGEFFKATDLEKRMAEAGIGVDVSSLKAGYDYHLQEVFDDAKLSAPDFTPNQEGGKEGRHTEYLGHMLADLQYMQRTYPDMVW
jgi:ring-1,2-phenylacetyl-CoA epoxidase subunit PaaC